jgi:predicted benzoate:H+ symporter BenE
MDKKTLRQATIITGLLLLAIIIFYISSLILSLPENLRAAFMGGISFPFLMIWKIATHDIFTIIISSLLIVFVVLTRLRNK